MGWQQAPYVYPALLATLVSTGLALRGLATVRRERGDVVVATFVALAVAIGLWTGGEAVAYARTDVATKLFWYRVGQIGAVAASPTWLCFTLAYTDRDGWLTRRTVALLSVVPLLAVLSLWFAPTPFAIADAHLVTSGGFRYLFVTVGPSFWLFRAYGYALVTLGTILLIHSAIRTPTPARGQVAILTGAPLLPFAGELASTFGLLPDDHVNYAALLLSVSTLGLGIAVFRYRLFDVRPVARATVVDNMRDGIVVADDDGRVVDLNAQAREILGVTGAVVEDPIGEVVPAYGRLSAAGAPDPVEATVDGRRFVELSRTPITRRGRHHGWVVTLRDVSARTRRERQIERQRRRLEQLATTVSHDLEGPLDIGQKWLDLLRDAIEDDGPIDVDFLAEGLDELEHANRRIDDIAADLVALTRAERRELDREPVSLGDAAHLAWHSVDAPHLTLDVVESTTLDGDRTKLLRLFENLFRNVVEHADGASRIRVGALPDAAGFYVEDDGDGLPARDRDALLRHGYSTKSGGSGLGLTVVQAIAEAHGWDVRLTEARAGGARFEFAATAGAFGT